LSKQPGGPILDEEEMAMPTYEFRCSQCGEEFERVMSVAEREKAKPKCPKCDAKKVEPVLSGFFAKTSRKS
jgi:putative FmdB family regulatory protein